jgi:hypothetical protein
MKNSSKRHLLDSAEYYYKKTINYSQNFASNKIVAKLSLGTSIIGKAIIKMRKNIL